MTIIDPSPVVDDEALRGLQLGNATDIVSSPVLNVEEVEPEPEDDADERPPVSPLSASAAAFLSTAAVGWMLGGTFTGTMPRLLGVLGALLGAAFVGLSYRMRNPSVLQFLALPVAAILGFALVAPSATGTSVPQLIVDAVKAGGLSQPPAPFDPGWRFLLLVLTCSIAVAAATAALATNRARLAVFLPAPVVAAGVIIQPPGKELLSVAPSLALIVAALAVAFGGELSRDSETGARFESRRLGKAAGLVVVIVAALVGLSQLGFLYPPTQDSTVIPPKRPQTPPPVTNNDVLFTVKETAPTPLRLGVLDVYNGTAWLTPPYDPKRYVPAGDGQLPAFEPNRVGDTAPPPAPAPKKTVTVEITVVKPGPAREVPDVSGTVSVSGAPSGSEFDPRAQTLRLPGHSEAGINYTVTAAAPPDSTALAAAKITDPRLKPFVAVPPPPQAVLDLISGAPKNLSPYERLQYVRTKFYSKITAAGPGTPVDVPPARVEAFLNGTPASPYEITASEVLMARWAGIPARIGYGYYNPDTKAGAAHAVDVRPSDGAMWLEVWFDNTGWTPILGKPPKAQSSLDDQQKKNDKDILSNGQITAQLYIPIRQEGLSLLYSIVQFWLARVAALIGVFLFFWILLPGIVKGYRRTRRRRWADRHGPREQLAAAYAEIRDRAIDFNIGHPTLTPLEFLDVLEPDEEHRQLAWLVTRGLWGDLRRDLRSEDVEAARTMSRSLYRRLVNGQPFLTRVVAFGSRVSLRDPWDATLPNPYWSRSPISVVIGWLAAGIRRLRPRMLPLLGRTTVLLVVCAFFTTGCVQQLDLSNQAAGVAALPTVPPKVGAFTFQRTTIADAQFAHYRNIALIQRFGFYVVRQDGVAVGTLQTASFKTGLRSENRKVREGVLTSLGGSPKVSKVAGQLFYTVQINDLRFVVWFPPDGLTYQLLSATKDLANPTDLFVRLIAVEQGRSAQSVNTHEGASPADARREA
ncbi:MAG TPA: transglutaminaseTgpA domain-containing protein [Mycobacteriales bacterium]|nr:transglutaminaseTgpA domain-containing protein [Mycobacteriales bacterium]